MMSSHPPVLGVLLPEDGPDDYEWYHLDRLAERFGAELPPVSVGPVPSDGHHDLQALRALGSIQRLVPIVENLKARASPQGVIWACTSGSFSGGLGWAHDQAEGLRAATGVPTTSTALAFVDAWEALGHRQVDLLSAYPEPVTNQLVTFLHEAGIGCRQVKALDCVYAADSHQLNVVDEVRAFCAQGPPDDSTPLMLPDTAINTLSLAEALGSVTQRTVLTANQVTLWAGLRLIGWSTQSRLLGMLTGY